MDEKDTVRPRGTDSAKAITVIQTKALSGKGTDNDPCKIVTQYWSMDGRLIGTKVEKEGGKEDKR